jgi:ABC-type Fe3+ transport system substrate-binding protein
MVRNGLVLAAAAIVIALPFLLRREVDSDQWKSGDPTLIIITPHNEAIRYEFARGFSRWHQARYGTPVRIEWREVGGTSEIARYLTAEYVTAFRAWYTRQGKPWPAAANTVVVQASFDTKNPPQVDRRDQESEQDYRARVAAERIQWQQLCEIYQAFRQQDDAVAFTSKIDLLFGGGGYDHMKAQRQGLTVAPWPKGTEPTELWASLDGKIELIPTEIGGSTWRAETLFGCAVSTFGICYNLDRIAELGLSSPPSHWDDLAEPAFFRSLGVADPTKSGSVSKAFELMVHQKCYQSVRAAGFDDRAIAEMERILREAGWQTGPLPGGVPQAYQAAIESGWLDGVRLMQRIGANARYFTDTSTKVPVDVSMGNATAGLAIDFYGRYQTQTSRLPDGRDVMAFVTPPGGSVADSDPISLLRGAEHRQTAVRFIEFVLSQQGQQLWTYAPGTPGGPEKYALRRIPIRRDFFPSDIPELQARHERHLQQAVDDLSHPSINPYAIAEQFVYQPRWTGSHFGVHSDLIRAMCIDSSVELKAAWQAILESGGPEANPEAMHALGQMPDQPEPLNWQTAPGIVRAHDRLDYLRQWTGFFRDNYRRARQLAESRQRRPTAEHDDAT